MSTGLKPKLEVRIEGIPLSERIIEFVTSCSVEMSRDKADMIKLTIANPLRDEPGRPRESELLWTYSEAFMPGNVIEIFMGYEDTEMEFVAAGIIREWFPHFPRTGMPTLELTAYDGSILLMDGTDEINARAARAFPSTTRLTEIAFAILVEYGLNPQIDLEAFSVEQTDANTKRAGTSDYQLLSGLARTLNWEFYVAWNPNVGFRQWEAFFQQRLPDTSQQHTFRWAQAFKEAGTAGGVLLDFDPEFAVHGNSTDVEVFYFDEGSRTWEKIVYPPPEPPAKKKRRKKKAFRWRGDDTSVAEDLASVGAYDGSRGLRIQSGGVSIEVVPKTGFKSAKEANDFAEKWWQQRQAMLIQGTGATVGWEKMKPGQVHTLQGLGTGLSGPWLFHEVTHTMQPGSAYENSFVVHKVIP